MTFYTLDIETSKEIRDGKPFAVWLSYGYVNRYSRTDNGELKVLSKYKFRTYQELHNILSLIDKGVGENKSKNKYIFVHNLSYEFDFILKNLSTPSKMLCNNTHKVIMCTFEKYQTIIFRCTYMMSQKSLRELGKDLGIPKLDDDYCNIFPHDTISEEKWFYCERDNDIVAHYISSELKTYRHLYNLPYTSTGKVRKELRERYKQDYLFNNCEWDVTPPHYQYKLFERAFWGGISISNPNYTGKIINNVISYDNTSQYPYVLLAYNYPSKMEEVSVYKPSKNYSYILEVEFTELESRFDWQWLSSSKIIYNPLNDVLSTFNGKIIHCSKCKLVCTNIDFENIKKTYTFESVKFITILRGKNNPLPNTLKDLIIHLAERKSTLKHELSTIDENTKEYIELYTTYMRSKSMLNGIYGMLVQSLEDDEYIIDEYTYLWTKIPSSYKKEGEHLKRNYLFGVFCTAYARDCILNFVLKYCSSSLVYIDTDSAKFIVNNHEEWESEIKCNKSVSNLSEYVKNFGVFEREHGREGIFEEFITFGAKKYAYKLNGNIRLVIAGLPKVDKETGTIKQYISSLSELKLGKKFTNCKLAHCYLYNNYRIIVDDENNISVDDNSEVTQFYKDNNIISSGGCALYETDYTLNMTENDLRYLKEVYNICVKKVE